MKSRTTFFTDRPALIYAFFCNRRTFDKESAFFAKIVRAYTREGDEKIGITYATDEEAALMGVEPESPLFWIVSTTYDQGGQMMEYCRAAARPDRLRITTVMERKLEGAITEYEA